MPIDDTNEKESKNLPFSTTFWSAAFVSYVALVTGIWGFVEAYTYFQSESLKNAIGPYWIGIYLIPIPIALIIGTIRSRTMRHQADHKASSKSKQEDHSISSARTGNFLQYKGLLWKRTRFSFRLPTPLCSRSNCGRPVYHKREYSPSALLSSDPNKMQEFLNKRNTYRNVYSCPVHGELREVPNVELETLRREAQFELRR